MASSIGSTPRGVPAARTRKAAEVVGVDYRFRPPVARPEDRGAPPPRYRRGTADGMIIERDVAVPVRGGVTVYADVFRPADGRPAPP
jgi:predicted acyl esterase